MAVAWVSEEPCTSGACAMRAVGLEDDAPGLSERDFERYRRRTWCCGSRRRGPSCLRVGSRVEVGRGEASATVLSLAVLYARAPLMLVNACTSSASGSSAAVSASSS